MSGIKDPIHAMSLLTAAFLISGTVLAAQKGDAYWTAVAMWGAALIILPYLKFGGRERSSINGLMPLVALPYIVGYLSNDGGSLIIPLTSPWYLPLSSMALFALCMVTIAFINSVSQMKLNLKFAMQVAFMFYASVVILQNPVFFYSDLWFGTAIVPGNTEIMSYIVLALANGLVMTVLFFIAARAMMIRRSQSAREVSD